MKSEQQNRVKQIVPHYNPFKNFDLGILFNCPLPNSLVSIFESLFEEKYIYSHYQMLKMIEETPKGYVSINFLLQQSIVQYFLKELQIGYFEIPQILEVIRLHSLKLICNGNAVRRIVPFRNKIADILPIYIDSFPVTKGMQELEELLESKTEIYKINYQMEQNWAIVYCKEPKKLRELNQHEFQGSEMFLRVYTHEQTMHQFDSLKSIRSYKNFKKLYEKKVQQSIALRKKPETEMKQQSEKNSFRYEKKQDFDIAIPTSQDSKFNALLQQGLIAQNDY